MSRIGKMPIPIPKGVTVTISGDTIRVKGPKGELSRKLVGNLDAKIENDTLFLTARDEETQTQAYHGLMRTLTNNMVVGVTEGFAKKLKIVGVGYTVSKDGVIELTSIDKELVGDTAARIRKIRKPDAYQGKGIRYIDEVVRLKPGKSAAKG